MLGPGLRVNGHGMTGEREKFQIPHDSKTVANSLMGAKLVTSYSQIESFCGTCFDDLVYIP